MPQSTTVLRFPGRRLSAEQKTSLPKHENTCFSMGEVSGKREATSGTVFPRPLEYWVERSVGIFKRPASRIRSCELRTRRSFSKIGRQQFFLNVDDEKRTMLR